MKRIIEHTADGSATLYIPQMDEHYHSTKGAETESQHVFIDMGMKERTKEETEVIRVFEVGFGTGLNAWLSLQEARQNNARVHYTAIELYPLPWETVETLQYSSDPVFKLLHSTDWNRDVEPIPGFILHKISADLTNYTFAPDSYFDVVYFDAFAPEKQPDMWTQEIFDTLYRVMNHNGVLTTYCAKGIIRRMLQQSGFTVERLPGPPGGKREILRARKDSVNNS